MRQKYNKTLNKTIGQMPYINKVLLITFPLKRLYEKPNVFFEIL